jgi:hypothetical protein
MRVTREIAFASESAPSVVVARAIGATCDKATLLYTINDEEDRPIWSWTSPASRAFGDVFAEGKPEEMRSFLERWASPDVMTTQDAPEWGALEPSQSTLDQFTYEDIRARDLPMLCHYSGTARQTCVFWEPAAGGAGLYFEREAGEVAE